MKLNAEQTRISEENMAVWPGVIETSALFCRWQVWVGSRKRIKVECVFGQQTGEG